MVSRSFVELATSSCFYIVGLSVLATVFSFATSKSITMRAFESKLEMDLFRLELATYWTNYRMLRAKPDNCKDAKMFIAIMSTSNFKSYTQRMAIREHVMNKVKDKGVVHKFFLGYQPGFRYDLIQEEMELYDDIVYYDADDNYRNNFLKWYSMYQWHQAYCNMSQYFVKMDDDTAVDVERLLNWTERKFDRLVEGKEDYLVCQRFSGMRPVRRKEHVRWYISEKEYPFKYWPSYCYGYMVVMSNSTVTKLTEASKKVMMIHMDDVLFTGLAARVAKVPVFDFEGFREKIHPRYPCTDDGLPYPTAVHLTKSPKAMARTYSTLHSLNCSAFDLDGP